MSAKYDLYETPDVQNTGEQQPLHARIVPSGTIIFIVPNALALTSARSCVL